MLQAEAERAEENCDRCDRLEHLHERDRYVEVRGVAEAERRGEKDGDGPAQSAKARTWSTQL